MAKLLRTKVVLENCKSHVLASDATGTAIESYLSQHVLVILCADAQQHYYEILECRLQEIADPEVSQFSLAAGKKILRSIGKSELTGFVAHFGPEAKRFFNETLEDRDITLYNNAVGSRHDVAHNSGTNITFRELDEIMLATINVISVFEQAISSTRPIAVEHSE